MSNNTKDNDYTYKLEQLRKMLAVELGEKGENHAGYGATLSHWYRGLTKPVQLDAEALKALIQHYESRSSTYGLTVSGLVRQKWQWALPSTQRCDVDE